MNKALVIYDMSGTVVAIYYGEDCPTPNGIPYMWVDIPQNATIDHIDIEKGEAVFSYLPETDLGQLQSQMAEVSQGLQTLENTSSSIYTDLANTQLAVAELYEMIIGGAQ